MSDILLFRITNWVQPGDEVPTIAEVWCGPSRLYLVHQLSRRQADLGVALGEKRFAMTCDERMRRLLYGMEPRIFCYEAERLTTGSGRTLPIWRML